MSDYPKILRKQLKNIVDEEFKAQVQNNMFQELVKQITAENAKRWEKIETHIKETLKGIDDRAKDVQSFIMREVAKSLQEKAKPENKEE